MTLNLTECVYNWRVGAIKVAAQYFVGEPVNPYKLVAIIVDGRERIGRSW